MAVRFEETTHQSSRYNGLWLITRCYEDDVVIGVDLGWREEAVNYRRIGGFKHEAEALFVTGLLDGERDQREVSEILGSSGFDKHDRTGFSTGSDERVRTLSDTDSAWIDYDLDETRFALVSNKDGYEKFDVGSIDLYSRGTQLEALGRPAVVATEIFCALLEARIAAGDAFAPLLHKAPQPTA